MSNKVVLPSYISGRDCYFIVQNEDGDVYDANTTTTFTAINTITQDDADIALNEQGTTGQYRGDFPTTVDEGVYRISMRELQGATPDFSVDTEVGVYRAYWNGGDLVDTALVDIMRGNAVGGSVNSITLGDSSPSTDDALNGTWISIVGGTGRGQTRLVTDYNGTTKSTSVTPNWTTAPAPSSVYRIDPASKINGVVGNVDGDLNGTVQDVDGFTATGAAEVRTEAAGALTDVNLDHLVGTATGAPSVPSGTYLNQIMSDGTATFDRTTDSLQAIRDRGDAAWVTGGGGSLNEILNIQPIIPPVIDSASTATWRLGLMLTNQVDDLPSLTEITPGTITIARKAEGGTGWSNIVTDAACSEAAGQIYFDEVFDSGSGYEPGDSLRITFKNQKVTVDANDYEITGTGGWIFYSTIKLKAASITADIDTNSTQLAAIVADTNELQADWADGGRLDVILDARASQASVDTVDTNVDAILVDTNELQTDWANGGRLDLILDSRAAEASITALNDISPAEVNAEVDTALTDIHLDHLFAASYDATAKPGAADALLNEIVEDDLGVTRFTANALEQGPVGGGTVNANVTQLLGTNITQTNAGDVAESFSAFFDVDPVTTKTVNDVGEGGGTGGTDWTSTEREQFRHRLGIDGTASAPVSGTPSLATAAAVTDLDTDVAAVKADTAAILLDTGTDGVVVAAGSKTGYTLAGASITAATFAANAIDNNAVAASAVTEIQSGLSTLTAADVKTQADQALVDYDPPTTAEMNARTLLSANYATAASIAALNDLSTAEVNAEVDTALADINLDHLMKVAALDADITDNSVMAQLASKSVTASWTSYDNTTDSLEGARDNVGTIVGGLNNLSAAEVKTQADQALADYDPPTNAEMEARTLVAADYATSASITALNDISTGEVNAEVDTALADINLDHLMKSAAAVGDVTDNSVIARLASKAVTASFTTYDNTVDSLEGIRDNIMGGDTQTVIDGVLEGIGGISAVQVEHSRTFRVLNDGKAANIVVVDDAADGTFAFDFSQVINPEQSLVGTITVELSPTIAGYPTNKVFNAERKKVHFDLDDMVEATTYTITCTADTTDSQTLSAEGILMVR